MQIAIALFPRLTALDAIGPYEVLQRLPGAEVVFVGERRGEVRTDNGFLGLAADKALHEVPRPDVIVVPGGIGTRAFLDGRPHALLDWLKSAHRTTRFTTSVCTGSLVLAAAGLLAGKTATTHWGARELLRSLGAVPVAQRVVAHPAERLVTAAGVSAGIDMALRLAAWLVDDVAAQAMQLVIEYDPDPPFDAGNDARATPEAKARLAEYSRTKS